MNTQKKLHIVFLDLDDIKNPLLSAGQAFATKAVGQRMVQQGHKVTVIASNYPGARNRVENGIQYTHIGWATNNIKLNNLIYILNLPFHIRRLKDVDVIFECFTAPISTLLTPLWTKIPVIAIPTCFDAKRFSEIYHVPVDQIEKWGSRFYKYFLPYTEELDNKMKQYNPSIISKIVPEGVEEEFFDIKRLKSHHILFLGRYDMHQKGIDMLIKAYKIASEQINIPLVIAGHGPDKNKIQNLITKLNLDKKVIMVGAAYGDKKKVLLAKALCVAFPSRFEGFSLFALEALASGTPLVSFDIPSLSWASEKTILKAPSFNIEAYAEQLIKIVKNRELSDAMSVQAREDARAFSWDRVSQDYLDFVYRVI